MHRSRINGILIDCNVDDIGAAAQFWADALGRPVDPDHPGTRGNYVMLETPPNEISVQIQRVDHESRVHIDIETDDIDAEVARLEKLGATVDTRMERWVVMRAPSGQRLLRRARSAAGVAERHDHLGVVMPKSVAIALCALL